MGVNTINEYTNEYLLNVSECFLALIECLLGTWLDYNCRYICMNIASNKDTFA